MTPTWITVSPANLYKLPSSEIIGSVAKIRVDGVKVDEGVGAGEPSRVAFHSVPDLCDEITDGAMAFENHGALNPAWHAELPWHRVGKIGIRVWASERM